MKTICNHVLANPFPSTTYFSNLIASVPSSPPWQLDSHLLSFCFRLVCRSAGKKRLISLASYYQKKAQLTSHFANLRSISPRLSACKRLSSFRERRTTLAATARYRLYLMVSKSYARKYNIAITYVRPAAFQANAIFGMSFGRPLRNSRIALQ